MDILHFLNVVIGFTLVMVVLSIITGGAAQAVLIILNTRTRAIANGLAGLLIGVGGQTIDKKYAKAIIVGLLTSPDGEETSDTKGGIDESLTWLRAKINRFIQIISGISMAYAL